MQQFSLSAILSSFQIFSLSLDGSKEKDPLVDNKSLGKLISCAKYAPSSSTEKLLSLDISGFASYLLNYFILYSYIFLYFYIFLNYIFVSNRAGLIDLDVIKACISRTASLITCKTNFHPSLKRFDVCHNTSYCCFQAEPHKS